MDSDNAPTDDFQDDRRLRRTVTEVLKDLTPYGDLRAATYTLRENGETIAVDFPLVPITFYKGVTSGFALLKDTTEQELAKGVSEVRSVSALTEDLRGFPDDATLSFDLVSNPVPYELQDDFWAFIHVWTKGEKALILVVSHPDVWDYSGLADFLEQT